MAKEALNSLTAHALDAIRAAAADGSLLHHRDLMFILYRWRNFIDNDPTEVRAWTDVLLKNDGAVTILARAMTGQSWSMGMGGFGGLGDRVSKASPHAKISDEIDILDVKAFRAALERIRDEGATEVGAHEAVRTFLEAWDSQREGGD